MASKNSMTKFEVFSNTHVKCLMHAVVELFYNNAISRMHFNKLLIPTVVTHNIQDVKAKRTLNHYFQTSTLAPQSEVYSYSAKN